MMKKKKLRKLPYRNYNNSPTRDIGESEMKCDRCLFQEAWVLDPAPIKDVHDYEDTDVLVGFEIKQFGRKSAPSLCGSCTKVLLAFWLEQKGLRADVVKFWDSTLHTVEEHKEILDRIKARSTRAP